MKTIFITGVGSGLGKCFFDQLLAKGYTVYGLLRNAEMYERMQAGLLPNGRLVLADISTDACIEDIRAIVAGERIDLLLNNAGIGGKTITLATTSSDEINRLLQVHCLGVLRVTQALQQNLLKSERAVVVNINSRFGSVSSQYSGVYKHLESSYSYRIAKAAQNMLTNCLRNDLGDRIEFISLTPGKMITGLAQTDADVMPEEAARRIIESWENGGLHMRNGILQLPDTVIPW